MATDAAEARVAEMLRLVKLARSHNADLSGSRVLTAFRGDLVPHQGRNPVVSDLVMGCRVRP